MKTYSVKAGDTLSHIAVRFKTTVTALAKANNLKNVNVIQVGQRLVIPDQYAGSGAVPTSELYRGMKGAEVKQLQQALVKLKHLSTAAYHTGPGTFGPRTEAALKAFQSAHGIEATGVYGLKSQAALAKALGKAPASDKPSKPKTDPKPKVDPTDKTPTVKGGVTVKQLRAIMPNLPADRAEKLLPYLNKAMVEGKVNTPKRQAAFLAQLAHESVGLTAFEEYASGAAYEGRKDLGNTQPGDGRRYKGRGPIQLTGRANYRAAGKALGLDLEGNPKRAADVDVGFRTAVWFWNSRGLSKYADSGNFDAITYRINGGYNGKASRDQYYARAKRVLT